MQLKWDRLARHHVDTKMMFDGVEAMNIRLFAQVKSYERHNCAFINASQNREAQTSTCGLQRHQTLLETHVQV